MCNVQEVKSKKRTAPAAESENVKKAKSELSEAKILDQKLKAAVAKRKVELQAAKAFAEGGQALNSGPSSGSGRTGQQAQGAAAPWHPPAAGGSVAASPASVGTAGACPVSWWNVGFFVCILWFFFWTPISSIFFVAGISPVS